MCSNTGSQFTPEASGLSQSCCCQWTQSASLLPVDSVSLAAASVILPVMLFPAFTAESESGCAGALLGYEAESGWLASLACSVGTRPSFLD